PAIHVNRLSKSFCRDKKALNDITLSVAQGEMVALIGASGSGKSTLLRHIDGLVQGNHASTDPRLCCIDVLGRRVQNCGKIKRDVRRTRADIGFIFQQFNLVNRLSVLTNVCMGFLGRIPAWRGAAALFTKDEKLQAMEALARVGIADLAGQRASTLSGGQQQRAAIARTLVQKAKIILADEPIASLDPASSTRVMETLAEINRVDGITVMVSLHQVDYATRYCPRTIAMRGGEIAFDGASGKLSHDFLVKLYGSDSEELILGHKLHPQPVTGIQELLKHEVLTHAAV
ncbi:MAG: phosphonate ABC transporter ATP-binding protein, partial [Rhodospirillales bacterium]